jgi:hypothetical protein
MLELSSELAHRSTSDFLHSWLAHAKGRIRTRTCQGYEGLIRLYAGPALGEVPLKNVHPLQLQLVGERGPESAGRDKERSVPHQMTLAGPVSAWFVSTVGSLACIFGFAIIR